MAAGNMPAGGRVWFITGTSTGFGRHLAEQVVARGERLVATARDLDAIGELVASAPDRVHPVELDVTDGARVLAAVADADRVFGRIDVLVNNAGYGLRGAIEEQSESDIRRQFETNVFGVLAVTRAVLPIMRRQRSGHIVQLSSVGGVVTRIGGTLYNTTKFALEGLSEGLATEVAHLGIKVTIVEPGPFRTDFSGRSIRWAEPMPDYAEVLVPERARFTAMHGTQPGDPARGAAAIIAAVDLPDPPLRLPLGAESFAAIRRRLTERLAELDEVETLGAHTAFE
jgi:NAD(P)-dependent dehydrogenase (short-subunit alcohol dehydrogenase family)